MADICLKGGVSDAPFDEWRAKFGGMEGAESNRLRDLEAEDAPLKRLLA